MERFCWQITFQRSIKEFCCGGEWRNISTAKDFIMPFWNGGKTNIVEGVESCREAWNRYFIGQYISLIVIPFKKWKIGKGTHMRRKKPPCRRMFPQILYLLRRTQCYNLLIISVLFSMPPFPTLLLKSFQFRLGLAVFQPNEWQLFKLLSPKVTHPSLKFIFDTQIEAPS